MRGRNPLQLDNSHRANRSTPTPSPTVTPTEASPLNYDVDPDVPRNELELVRSGIELGRAYLATRVGGDIPPEKRSRIIVKVVATGRGNPSPGASGGGCTGLDDDGIARPFFDVRHSCWNATPSYGQELHKLKTAAHEYTHSWQNLTRCSGRAAPGGPYSHLETWISEGEGEFIGHQALIPGRLQSDAMRRWHLDVAVRDGQASESLRNLEYLGQRLVIWPGNIGYLALEDLTSRAPGGVLALRNHCEALGRGVERDQAFLTSFGVSKAEFYAAFPIYVAQLRTRYGI